MHFDEVGNVSIEVASRKFFVQLRDPAPGLDRIVCFLFAREETEKCEQGIRTLGNDIAEQRIRIRTNPPGCSQGGVRKRAVVGDNNSKFLQRAIRVAANEEKVARLPSHIGSGRFRN